jgi:hypothetical protein
LKFSDEKSSVRDLHSTWTVRKKKKALGLEAGFCVEKKIIKIEKQIENQMKNI